MLLVYRSILPCRPIWMRQKWRRSVAPSTLATLTLKRWVDRLDVQMHVSRSTWLANRPWSAYCSFACELKMEIFVFFRVLEGRAFEPWLGFILWACWPLHIVKVRSTFIDFSWKYSQLGPSNSGFTKPFMILVWFFESYANLHQISKSLLWQKRCCTTVLVIENCTLPLWWRVYQGFALID